MSEALIGPFNPVRFIEQVPAPSEPDLFNFETDTYLDTQLEIAGKTYRCAELVEYGEIPQGVAEWLKYWSFNDGTIAIQTEGDRAARFNDIEKTKRDFLTDHGGRRLFVAVDEETRKLAGAVWIHPLQGDESDVDLVEACREYAQRSGVNADPVGMATLAVRVYNGFRNNELGTTLVKQFMDRYYATWKDCQGMIIRINPDRKVVSFFEDHTEFGHMLHVTPRDDGVAMMVHTRPLPRYE